VPLVASGVGGNCRRSSSGAVATAGGNSGGKSGPGPSGPGPHGGCGLIRPSADAAKPLSAPRRLLLEAPLAGLSTSNASIFSAGTPTGGGGPPWAAPLTQKSSSLSSSSSPIRTELMFKLGTLSRHRCEADARAGSAELVGEGRRPQAGAAQYTHDSCVRLDDCSGSKEPEAGDQVDRLGDSITWGEDWLFCKPKFQAMEAVSSLRSPELGPSAGAPGAIGAPSARVRSTSDLQPLVSVNGAKSPLSLPPLPLPLPGGVADGCPPPGDADLSSATCGGKPLSGGHANPVAPDAGNKPTVTVPPDGDDGSTSGT